MQSRTYPTLKLTSTVIPSNPEGKYPYYTLGFLIPHEMLRREFNRARIAIDNLDTVAAPWKADALLEWLDAFLIPLLHAHHHIEDNIIFPFYYALGIVPPERQAEDHISLIGRMNKLQSLSRQLVHYGHYGKTANKPETIRSYEDRVKKEFLDMIIHFERHFAEEEEFWPSLLEKYGERNWARVERMVIQYTISFGDHNAGDPYRMLICAVSRALGIVIGKDELDPDEIPWSGIDFQNHYISSRPFMVRKVKVVQWNARYLQFRKLIEAIGGSNNVVPQKKNGKTFVDKTKKPFVPLILFVFLSAIFCLATLPLFASVSNPLRNVKSLHIKYVNYDRSGVIGAGFDTFLSKVSASSNEIPTFQYEPSDKSYETYEQRVLDGEAWAVIGINPDASAKLAAATANGCADAALYNPTSAISFSWDEGRNSIVAAPYIAGFSRGIINRFSAQFAASYLSTLSSTTIQQCLANGKASLLTDPIAFYENNLSPAATSFVVTNIGITIGNILMAVFGSMFILNATYNGVSALAEDYSPVGKIALKAFTMALVGMGMSACYATAMVGLTRYGSSEHTYSGTEWAQVFAIQWLHIMIWSFGMGSVSEGLSPALVPFFFVVLMLYSIIGGWNSDLADQGYKHFFQIFPFHWVIYILRYSFYKSQGFHRGISGGILISYWIVTLVSYFYLGIKNERMKHLFSKIVVVEEIDSVSGKLGNEDDDHVGGPPPSTEVVSRAPSGHLVYHVVKTKDEAVETSDNTAPAFPGNDTSETKV